MEVSFAFQKPFIGDARRNLGLMNGEKRLPPLCELKKKRPPGEVESVRGKVDDCGSVVDDD